MGTRPSPEQETAEAARVKYLEACRRLDAAQGRLLAFGLPLDPGGELNRVHWTPAQAKLATELAAAWAELVATRREYDGAWKRYKRYGGGYR